MIPILVNILILLIVAVVVFLAAKWIMAQADFDPPLQKIILLILGLVFLLWLVSIITGGSVFPLIPVPNGRAV